MHAYWSERADIGDEGVLLDLAAEAGLERQEAETALAERTYAERVDASTRRANMHGINAIPAFVFDARLLVLGAHPHETFEHVMKQLENGLED
jgi:predicted DsbA family dithiol-disulfide isomerase